MTTRILCPVDLSESSLAALRYAEELTGKLDGELILAHAFRCPGSWDMPGQTKPSDEIRQNMEALTCELASQRLLHAGPPGPVICWLAQEHACDLIVMGTHGHTGLKHLLMGSTAEYVLQHARCPVLTVRDRKRNEPQLQEPIVMPLPGPGA